jgi:hypothetical protein
MRCVRGLIEWNLLTQLALLALYLWQTDLLTALYILHRHSASYFVFCTAGAVAMAWMTWTGFTAALGLRRLGRKVDQSRRARGVRIHPTAAGRATAYPVLQRTETVLAGAGLVLGWLYGRGHLTALLATPVDAALLYRGFGPQAAGLLTLHHGLAGAALGFCLARVLHNVSAPYRRRTVAPPARMAPAELAYQLPAWPVVQTSCSLILGEQHAADGTLVREPAWYRLPERGLFGNLVAFGGIGSGKTAGVLYPLLRQFLEFRCHDPGRKIGGLIMDYKGDFAQRTAALAATVEREADLVLIRPGGTVRWNPIHQPTLMPQVLAGRLLAIYQNITGDPGTGDHAWITQGVLWLLTHAIGMLREAHGYVTLADVNRLLGEIGSGEVKDVREVLQTLQAARAARPEPSEAHWRYHTQYFAKDWPADDHRTRAIILSAAKSVTRLFDVPEIAATFCPPADAITFPGFEAMLDDGRLVVLDMPDAQYGVLTTAIGMLLKLEFQRAALHRVARAAHDPHVNTQRNLCFVCDEYQHFVSVGGSTGEGDDKFFALSRQSRCISLVASQSPVSLLARIGEERTRVILASMRTKIFLSLVDPQDAELAAEICGQEWQGLESVAVAEQLDEAAWNPLDASVRGSSTAVSETRTTAPQRAYRIEPLALMQLRTFEAIVAGFDGWQQREPTHIYLKPDFLPDGLTGYTDPREVPFQVFRRYVATQEATAC